MIARTAALALGLASSTALAGTPRIHVERCESLDAAAVEAAVARELAIDPVAKRVDVTVEIECPDGVHAHVRVEPGAHVRDLDLSEEPAALRVKLVALAIAEVIAVLDYEPSLPLASPAPPPVDRVAPAPAALIAEPARRPEVTVRAGVRVIAWDQDMMTTVAADLDIGLVRVGLFAALGEARSATGTPYLIALALGRNLACSHGRTSVCIVARGELGFDGVSIHPPQTPAIMSRHFYAGYWDASVGLEVRRRMLGVDWLVGVDLGAGDGLIVEDDYLEHLDGPFAAATLGMSW